jgi:hypothetical protein
MFRAAPVYWAAECTPIKPKRVAHLVVLRPDELGNELPAFRRVRVAWERIFREKYGQQEQDYYAAGREPRSSGVSAQAFVDASIYACAEEELCTKSATPESNRERFCSLLRRARYTHTAA